MSFPSEPQRSASDPFTITPSGGTGPDPETGDPSLLPDSDGDGEDEIDPSFYANGGNVFSEDEIGALGELAEKRVLHLTFGCSEESLSLVNMGATVTEVGDDGTTMALADAAGLALEFVEDNAAALSMEFRETRAFDLVYSGFGAIDWIANLDDWASGIADVLVPGGRLVVYDEHPISYVFAADEAGRMVVASSYFGGMGDDAGGESEDDDSEADTIPLGSAASADDDEEDDEAEQLIEDSEGASWTLGDLVGALGTHGLAVIDLQEFMTSDRYETALDRLAEEVDEDEIEKVPSALLLVAVKLP